MTKQGLVGYLRRELRRLRIDEWANDRIVSPTLGPKDFQGGFMAGYQAAIADVQSYMEAQHEHDAA